MPSVHAIRNFIGEWGSVFAGLLLIGIGILGYYKWYPGSLAHQLAEAFIIAGVVTITVDPFLKRRLLKETSKDIFHHMIGFGLPNEIKERIHDIAFKTDLYRNNMELGCTFVPVQSGMRIDFDYKFQVVNPSNHSLEFHQYFEFEKQENAVLTSVSCSGGKANYGKNAALAMREDDELMIYKGPSISIPPEKEKHEITFRAAYSVTRHSTDFHIQNFTHPTIGFTLFIRNKPADLKVTASPATTQRQNEWIYKRLFMPGDHMEIRWESSSD